MAASVNLIVRKFVEGNDNYRKALHTNLIDIHPECNLIVKLIEEAGVNYGETAPAR